MPEETLFELIRKRIALLLTADDIFLKSIRRTEFALWRIFNSILNNLTVRSGRIVKDESSTSVIINSRRNVTKAIAKSPLKQTVTDFLPRFDQVESLQGKIYGRIASRPGFKMPNTAVAKRMAVERVVASLGELRGLDPVYIQPLIQRMFTAVESQMQISAAREYIRDYIVGTSPSGGQLSRYSRQITMDLLNGYDGFIQQQLRQEYGYDGMFYVGSLIKDSRPNCVHLINGSGWFENLAIRPGFFAAEDIPEIVNRASMPTHSNGWRPETTPETFPIYRCGFNCRHAVLFTDLTNGDVNIRLSKIQREIKKSETGSILTDV